jgi:hypothetical protein
MEKNQTIDDKVKAGCKNPRQYCYIKYGYPEKCKYMGYATLMDNGNIKYKCRQWKPKKT